MLFGTLDFADGKGTFQSVCLFCKHLKDYDHLLEQKLGLQHAPVLILFNPTTGPNAKADSSPVRFDFSAGYVCSSSFTVLLMSNLLLDLNRPNLFTHGSLDNSQVDRSLRLDVPSIGSNLPPSQPLFLVSSLSSL